MISIHYWISDAHKKFAFNFSILSIQYLFIFMKMSLKIFCRSFRWSLHSFLASTLRWKLSGKLKLFLAFAQNENQIWLKWLSFWKNFALSEKRWRIRINFCFCSLQFSAVKQNSNSFSWNSFYLLKNRVSQNIRGSHRKMGA